MKFTIYSVPKGQRRTRACVRRTRACVLAGHARVFKDKRQAAEEQIFEALLARYQPSTAFTGPLLLGVKAYLPIPQSKPVKWRQAALNGQIRPTVKPDMDNMLKHVKDCLSAMRFWDDDKLVVGYLPGTGKYYGEPPRWEIEIIPWRPEDGGDDGKKTVGKIPEN